MPALLDLAGQCYGGNRQRACLLSHGMARPDAIVHQMTALSAAHAGKPDLKHPHRFFATTVRLRSEGTDHLLAAAEATGGVNARESSGLSQTSHQARGR